MRVFNKKYWPHQVVLRGGDPNLPNSIVIERWCYKNFKSANWRNIGYYFVFKNGLDATLFTLKWM